MPDYCVSWRWKALHPCVKEIIWNMGWELKCTWPKPSSVSWYALESSGHGFGLSWREKYRWINGWIKKVHLLNREKEKRDKPKGSGEKVVKKKRVDGLGSSFWCLIKEFAGIFFLHLEVSGKCILCCFDWKKKEGNKWWLDASHA